jgi:hypothetical protein
VFYNSNIYIFGGSQKVDFFCDIWSFDLKDGKWIEIKPKGKIPDERYFHSATVYKHFM